MSEQRVSTRFASPTQGFDPDILIGRLRKGFLLSVALAATIHLVVAGINPFAQTEQQVLRPLTTKFVKRQPRLTKSLELRKIPKFKRHMIRGHIRVAAARMDQVQATAVFSMHSIVKRATGAAKMHYVVQNPKPRRGVLEPKMELEADLGISRTGGHRIDMALEMLDVNALDTGRYRAVVVQNSNDVQGRKGFVKLARVHSIGFVIDGSSEAAVTGGLNIQEIDILCDMINEWTGLRADFAGSFTFSDERLLDIPIVMPQGQPTEGELRNIARYLVRGGFVLLEGLNRDEVRRGGRDIYGYLREALQQYGGLVEGQDFYLARLPDDHSLFSAYFDLGGGAPRGASSVGIYTSLSQFNVVEGFFVKGRLVAVSRPLGYDGLIGHSNGVETTRIMQFVVNTIVFALTQEGSITQRLMQTVN